MRGESGEWRRVREEGEEGVDLWVCVIRRCFSQFFFGGWKGGGGSAIGACFYLFRRNEVGFVKSPRSFRRTNGLD